MDVYAWTWIVRWQQATGVHPRRSWHGSAVHEPGESHRRIADSTLLADRKEESLTVYTDGFRAYDPLEVDDAFDREYVVHGDGEHADDEVHLNSCESHASLARRADLAPLRCFEGQVDTVSQSVSTVVRTVLEIRTRCIQTLFELHCEINNVLRISNTENRVTSGPYLRIYFEE